MAEESANLKLSNLIKKIKMNKEKCTDLRDMRGTIKNINMTVKEVKRREKAEKYLKKTMAKTFQI